MTLANFWTTCSCMYHLRKKILEKYNLPIPAVSYASDLTSCVPFIDTDYTHIRICTLTNFILIYLFLQNLSNDIKAGDVLYSLSDCKIATENLHEPHSRSKRKILTSQWFQSSFWIPNPYIYQLHSDLGKYLT